MNSKLPFLIEKLDGPMRQTHSFLMTNEINEILCKKNGKKVFHSLFVHDGAVLGLSSIMLLLLVKLGWSTATGSPRKYTPSCNNACRGKFSPCFVSLGLFFPSQTLSK